MAFYRCVGNIDNSIVTGISCQYTHNTPIYEFNNINELRNNLIVYEHYNDSKLKIITDYILSGTLTAGISIITISWKGFTTNVEVNVSEALRIWDLTESLTDDKTGEIIDASNAQWISGEGIKLSSQTNYFYFNIGSNPISNYTVEIDIGDMERTDFSEHGRFLMHSSTEGYIFRRETSSNMHWQVFSPIWQSNQLATDITDPNFFKNTTLKLVSKIVNDDADTTWTIYKNTEKVWQSKIGMKTIYRLSIGSGQNQSFYGVTIKAIRAYVPNN